jgi:hypothetical protein
MLRIVANGRLAEVVTLYVYRRWPVKVSAQMPVILTVEFCGISESVHAGATIVPDIISRPWQYIILQLSCHMPLCGLSNSERR